MNLPPVDAAAHAARMKRLAALRTEAESAPLMPCPFCGSDGVLTCKVDKSDRVWHFVVCVNIKCGCSLRWASENFIAVTVWNRRLINLTIKHPEKL